MCWPSGVTVTAFTERACPGVGRAPRRCGRASRRRGTAGRRRASNVRRRGRPQSARRRAAPRRAEHVAAHLEGALESAVERPQLRGAVVEPLTKRAPPGSTATAQLTTCARLDGALARAVAPHLDGVVVEPVMMRPSGAAHATIASCPCASVTTSPENGRNFASALRSAQQRGTSAPLQRCRGRAAAGRARGPGRPPAAPR